MKILVIGVLALVLTCGSTFTVSAATNEDVEQVLSSYDKENIQQLLKQYKAFVKSLESALKELKKGKKSKYYESFKGTSSNNKSIESAMNNIRAQAEIYANQDDGTVDYTGVCSDAGVVSLLTSIEAKNSTGNAYCVAHMSAYMVVTDLVAPLKGSSLCVDSTGAWKTFKGRMQTIAFACPTK
jgi:hypothetical protein